MGDNDDNSSVRVAVRIRPQLPREKIDNCRVCTSVTPGEPQVVLGNDKAFTFDKVFDIATTQEIVFSEYAQPLIEGCFDGYNATILAYGQTGSGKTHSMGTGFDLNTTEDQVGIIPRAVRHLFDGIELRRNNAVNSSMHPPTFQVLAQFMELYNEEIYDLFDSTSEGKKSKSNIKIHEDANGSIYTQGVTNKQVNSYNETMDCLRAGALSRTTASTNMNSQSSRSHAIFTLHIKQTRTVPPLLQSGDDGKEVDTTESSATVEFETLTAKFNFVDLAGSERLKRTGATGDRAKEGISINCGLLALGNVISALGDATKKGSHVPYRDSKLTRLLQDSLGGNSRTVMIACISPSDRDFMETLNTLKYANRARNIKNRITVNQDKTSKQLTELRVQIQALQVELAEYKQGKRIVGPDGVESINDMFHENSLLQVENDKLKSRVKVLNETVDSLTSRNASLLNDKAAVILGGLTGDGLNEEVQKLVADYTTEMETLRTKLLESESMRNNVCKSARTPSRSTTASTDMFNSVGLSHSFSSPSMESTMSIIELAKQDVRKSKRALKKRESTIEDKGEKADSGGGSGPDDDSGEHEEEVGADEEANDDTDIELEDVEGDDLEEELSSESESDSDHLEEDLAELSGEISIKQKMIEELEKSQRQLQNIRQHYEDKLRNLQNQIQEVERERDQVLNSLTDKQSQSDEQVKKVKQEYEKKLTTMQSELSKINAAKKEHAKMMKNQAVYDKRIKELSGELNEMKKIKVRLMAQMKTESDKNKVNDQKKNKELIQLRKEKRIRDNQLKMLELQNRQKDAILKRKHEEVNLLRKKQRESSASAKALARTQSTPATTFRGRNKLNNNNTTTASNREKATPFSPKVAKSKWDKMEHYISSVVMRKQTISSMESEMDLHINKREELSKKIETYNKKLEAALHRNQTELAMDIEDQLESMSANLNYVQSNISECQTSIMQMEEEAKDASMMGTVLDVSSVEESKYLLEHLLSLALSRGFESTQKDIQYKELTAKYEKLRMDSRLTEQLLEQVLKDAGITLQDGLDNETDEGASGDNGSARSSPLINSDSSLHDDHVWAELSSKHMFKSSKARRRTATPSELLLGMVEGDNYSSTPSPTNSDSPLGGKPTISIADIIPPAPKGPPPGRGPPPPPIGTIIEEEETEAPSISLKTDPSREDDSSMNRSGSYTVLNSVMIDKPEIKSQARNQSQARMNGSLYESTEGISSSGTSTPDNELNLESNKLLAGSYTILNGEIRLDRIPSPVNNRDNINDLSNSSMTSSTGSNSGSKKVPPQVPPKPSRPPTLGHSASTGSLGKWKGVVSSHLDTEVSLLSPETDKKTVDSKPPLASLNSSDQSSSGGRVLGRRKLAPGSSPAMRRKTFQTSSSKEKLTLSTSIELKEPRQTPPSSPSLSRKRIPLQDDSNVFTRLTSNQSLQTTSKKLSTPGFFIDTDKTLSGGQSIVCLKRAKGHSKAVLAVTATEELMFTGSKDQTCKVWDLSLGAELMSLEDHPNYVTRVRYCDLNKLVYTVANSFVKVWDVRSPHAKCLKVLSSSGLVHDSIPVEPASSSQAILQQGEQLIFDIQVSPDGNTLYTTTGSTVRVWDLRMYGAIGKVASGHQAPIICLSLLNTPDKKENLITGSKDHFIKLFDLSSSDQNCLVQPKFTLEPPHYDGVQCLAHRGVSLFSGSRDMCIKKWNLDDQSLVQSVNGAHKDWILDLCMLPDNDVILSCCRAGAVKLWSTDTCVQLDEVKAHSSSVNCLAANSSHVFTASSDDTVKIWKIDHQKLNSL